MSIPLQIMRNGFRLGRFFDIEVNLNQSSLFLALMVAVNGFAVFGFSGLSLLLVPLFTILLIFSILAHEYGHALTARAFGIETEAITLHALGGVAKIKGEPRTPGQEFLVAVAGPLVSFLMAALFLAMSVAAVVVGLPGMSASVLQFLMFSNLALGIFNMLPGLPLDGGRALRGIIWHFKKDRNRATVIAARGGEIIGLLFYGLAFINLFSGGLGSAIFAGFMGWFLRSAAKGEKQRATAQGIPNGNFRNIFELLRHMQRRQGPRGMNFRRPQASSETPEQDGDVEVIRYPDGREVYIRKN